MKSCSLPRLFTPPVQTWIPNPNDSGKGCLAFFDTSFHEPRLENSARPSAISRRGEAQNAFPRPFPTRSWTTPFSGPLAGNRYYPLPTTASISLSIIPGFLFHSSSLIWAPCCFFVSCVVSVSLASARFSSVIAMYRRDARSLFFLNLDSLSHVLHTYTPRVLHDYLYSTMAMLRLPQGCLLWLFPGG